MAFELTVLGSAGSHTGPGRVCSGYLLRADATRVMVDCGNGSTANLQRTVAFEQLDAVVVSHRHADHCVDLIGMFYALSFYPGGPRHVDLYAAPEVVDTLSGLLSRDSATRFQDVFHPTEVSGGDAFEVGPIRFDAFDSIHPVPTVSLRASVAGTALAYSADSAGGGDLAACARDADLFLCEASWQGRPEDWPVGIHLTASQAGDLATRAGARRLLLTHVAGPVDRQRSYDEAAAAFDGQVALAEDGDVWTVA